VIRCLEPSNASIDGGSHEPPVVEGCFVLIGFCRTSGLAEFLNLGLLCMSRLFIFADEAGCFNFSRAKGASKFYTVCTITCNACSALGAGLLDLRRELIWERTPVGEYFHASEDKQAVRDRVFALLQKHDFSIQATLMEKSKAMPKIRPTNHRFYQYAWFYHFKFAAPKVIGDHTEMHITTASVGTHKGQAHFTAAVNDVVQQIVKGKHYRTNFCRSVADPCLQAADYCTWAIHKKWETGNTLSYDLIKDKIIHEVDSFSAGRICYY
jgi:hypothetical protein